MGGKKGGGRQNLAGAMTAVVDRERARRDESYVPRILVRHVLDTPSQGKHTSLNAPSTSC